MKPFLERENRESFPALRGPAAPGDSPPTLARLPGCARAGARTVSNPHVEVIKEGDKVVRLVVTCACGERVEIDCLYAAGS